MGRAAAKFRRDARHARFRLAAGLRVFLGLAGLGGPALAHVANVHPPLLGMLVRLAGARVIAIDRGGSDAEDVLHAKGDAARFVLLEFGEGDENVGLLVGGVQCVGGENEAASRRFEARISSDSAFGVGVLELDHWRDGPQRPDIPARVEHELFQRTCRRPGALNEPDASRPGLCQEMDERGHLLGVGVVGHAQRPAVQAQTRTSSEVQFYGYGLAFDQPAEPAELLKQSAHDRGLVFVIAAAAADRDG